MTVKPTSVTVFPPAAQALRLFSVQVGGMVGQRLTMTEALQLACNLATTHMDEAPDALRALGITTTPEVDQ